MSILPIQLARVSDQLRSSIAQSTIAQTQQELLDTQNELTTGKRLNVPSDDPAAAAVAQQLHKTLEQRDAYSTNLQRAGSQLGEVDTTLGDMTDLLQQAQNIASQNVGSTVTAGERQSAAAVVQSLYDQMLSVSNRQLNGTYLFAGDSASGQPFVESQGGVQFTGTDRPLQTTVDDNTQIPFMVDGVKLFGATSSRVEGDTALAPNLTAQTRLIDVGGAQGTGIHLGSITLSNGATSASVDLSKADTVQDAIDLINKAQVGGITAAIAANGKSLSLAGAGGDNITVTESGSTTAADLGLLTSTGGGAGVAVQGSDLSPQITILTPLTALRGGAGINTAGGFTIKNGLSSATIDLSQAQTVEDVLNAINSSNTGVVARINDAGTGIDVVNSIQGPAMSISENGGTTAADLGIRSFSAQTQLADLNGGKGVQTSATGADIQITRRDGSNFSVDLSGAKTVQDAIAAINAASGGTVTAAFSTTGNGITLTDSTGGSGALSVKDLNNSNTTAGLGLDGTAAGNVLGGADVNTVQATGMFANLAKLRDALKNNDTDSITDAAQSLKSDLDRTIETRGENGARVKEIEGRQQRIDDQNVATQTLLSSLEDTDFTQAVTRFQTLQTSLQAAYQTTALLSHQSLMDFLS